MISKYVHDGKAIDIRPTADIAAGDVVVIGAALVGIAVLDIKAGELGALATSGVFDIAKPDGTTFAAGTVIYWDEATQTAVATTSKPRLGVVTEAAEAGDATVRVKLG
ncbi:MAG: DUF2190 family protein [Candidatus Spyradenecus sp.]